MILLLSAAKLNERETERIRYLLLRRGNDLFERDIGRLIKSAEPGGRRESQRK